MRKWSNNKHKKVDDRPFGGGLGMVMSIEPIFRAVLEIKKNNNSKVILFGLGGKKFNQATAHRFSNIDQLILICGRYEGVDERIAEYIADEEISIGNYVLMGGEIPAMAVIESVSRLIPGVIGKKNFLKERTKNNKKALEYPQFTRPAIFKPDNFLSSKISKNLILNGRKLSEIRDSEWKVPDVLISGDHHDISEWRNNRGRII